MKNCNICSLAALALVVVFSATFVSLASAAPQFGASIIVAADGDVVATFQGHTAGLTNDLYLDSPANALGVIFTNQTTPVGTQVNLGSFLAGTELIFRMHVNGDEHDFFTGPASRNSDSVIHALVDEAVTPDESYVGFEDLLGGGDFNYFDLNFSLTNTRAEGGVPEPATCVLCGMGVALLAFARRSARG